MPTTRYVQPSELRAILPPGAVHPRIQIGEEMVVLSAQIRRMFPLSKPSEFICIQDGIGAEIGILTTLEGLDDASRKTLEAELDRRYFTPSIQRIDDLVQEAGMWHFTVGTQRGDTDFYVRNWRDSAHEIGPGRWQIYAVDGGRYDIPNLEALDVRSRKLMAKLL